MNLSTIPVSVSIADEEDKKDRPFYPYRVPKSDSAKAVMADVLNQITSYEQYFGLRKRARKVRDQAIFEETITAVICDLIHRHSEDPDGSVSVSLSNRVLGKKSRYRHAALGKTLPRLLKNLAAPEMDFITISKGHREEVWDEDKGLVFEGRQTTLQPGPKLISRIIKYDLTLCDLATSDTAEIIILKDKKIGGKDGRRLEYQDTANTVRFRDELRSINEWLAAADIELDEFSGVLVDTTIRGLRRVFNNGSFSQGGRLWGGFWMNLKKEVRREDLVITGERVAELDFGQMAVRLMYGKVGATPPAGDLYDIPELPWRDGVKQIINSALYSDKQQTRMPQGVRQRFPSEVSYCAAFDAIANHHAAISELFFSGVGMELMFQESEILVDVLLQSQSRGIVVLPMHDGVIVAASQVPVVKTIMEEVFENRTGVEAVVSIEP